MIIIIDAYNVLKQIAADHYISSVQRDRFITQLAAYKKAKKHTICVVFDGGNHTWPIKERIKAINVIYSGTTQTAYHMIKQFIENNRKKSILLVSSDRELVQWASDYEVPSLGSTDFYQLLQETVYKKVEAKKSLKTALVKTSTARNKELDTLMRELVDVEQKNEDRLRDALRTKKTKLKKNERALLRKVNKL